MKQPRKRLTPQQARRLLIQARRRKFDPTSSAKAPTLERIRTVWHIALKLFRNATKTERFLLAPHPALRMVSPAKYASASDVALQEIVDLLDRLKFGSAL
jgi:putative toxin-antitoxin system antitoxin component (TIGR02293 family)